MKLIVNADDLGFTKGINEGIYDGYKNGIIRSTTALVNSPYFEEGLKMLDGKPDFGIGVHLNLTLGKSLTKNKTLTDENGNFFPGRKTIWEKNPDYEEIYNEWKAQIDKFIEVAGHLPSHLDSHHSVHDATPEAYEVSSRLAKEYGLPMRRYSSYKYVPDYTMAAYTGQLSPEFLIETLKKYESEDIEMMVHPGYCNRELYEISSYSLDRVKELSGLCNKKVLDFVKENNVELVHY